MWCSPCLFPSGCTEIFQECWLRYDQRHKAVSFLLCLLLKGLHGTASAGQIPHGPTSPKASIAACFSALNFSLENTCLWLQNFVQSEGRDRGPRWDTGTGLSHPNCVGCVRELPSYPHCCFLSSPIEVIQSLDLTVLYFSFPS